MDPIRLTKRSLTASCLMHLVAISGLAAWSASSHETAPKFAGQDSVIELVVTRVDSTWSPQAITLEPTTSNEVRVTVEPTTAMIARKRFEQAAATDLLFDSVVSKPTSPATKIGIDRPERVRAETLIAATDDSPAPVAVLPRQRPEPRKLQIIAIQPPQRVGTDRTSPSFTSSPPPTYPTIAIQSKWEGTVLLRVYIDVNGAVSEVQVARSSGFPVLDGAAVNAVRRWSGSPATLDGRAVPTTELLPIRFRLRD